MNIEKFNQNLEIEIDRFNSTSIDANENFKYLTEFLKKLLNKYFPVKTKKISSKRITAPWITSKMLRCIRRKHRWIKLAKQGMITWQSYKTIQTSVRKLLSDAQEDYCLEKLNSFSNNNQKNWRLLNKLMVK